MTELAKVVWFWSGFLMPLAFSLQDQMMTIMEKAAKLTISCSAHGWSQLHTHGLLNRLHLQLCLLQL